MTNDKLGKIDEDLTLRFHWRWNEHGIYLGVCSVISLMVLGLYMLPTASSRRFRPELYDMIHVHYVTASDDAPEKDDPFHDPRLLRLPVKLASADEKAPAM
jgi:hypothetical protein